MWWRKLATADVSLSTVSHLLLHFLDNALHLRLLPLDGLGTAALGTAALGTAALAPTQGRHSVLLSEVLLLSQVLLLARVLAPKQPLMTMRVPSRRKI